MKIYFAGKMPRQEKFFVTFGTNLESDARCCAEATGDDANETILYFKQRYIETEDGRYGEFYEELTDWRWEIVPNLGEYCGERDSSNRPSLMVLGGHDYGGPFYRLTDITGGHGIYEFAEDQLHGHSVPQSPICYKGHEIQSVAEMRERWRHFVFVDCCSQIENSDVVFCWFDDWTCFGTMCELGFAHAHGKPIFIGVPTQAPNPDDVWFPLQTAWEVIPAQSALEAFKTFLINHGPRVAEMLVRAEMAADKRELNALKSRINEISAGRNAAWRELFRGMK